ncbi:cbb3-type cytochrome oxidase assembly protein CcoS [Stenoxybacter acetivorans]|uniref:cbb3-type cytochrome oxidase assembly protein CcoS n=1 Tax=Stenoxybacter acetivorans TaxID=422441 RepID=UPI000560B6DF|nr:cbb3-type cytochrome oxidase assembly protein CcoS [Stenoxybacter acetivorans]
MESIYILIPVSIILVFVIGYFFWWSGKSGQFDDLTGPAHRILLDDDSVTDLVENKETKDGSALNTQDKTP